MMQAFECDPNVWGLRGAKLVCVALKDESKVLSERIWSTCTSRSQLWHGSKKDLGRLTVVATTGCHQNKMFMRGIKERQHVCLSWMTITQVIGYIWFKLQLRQNHAVCRCYCQLIWYTHGFHVPFEHLPQFSQDDSTLDT